MNESKIVALVGEQDQRPILILVNPHSGRGKSIKIFERHISKLLSSHGVKYDLFVTTNKLRVGPYLLSKSLEELIKYKAIMVIGGDGLLYETVNSIMTRQDWQQVIDIPVGVVPTGSGNGLAYTMINTSRLSVNCQTEAVKVCCEQIIHANRNPCDLVRLRYGKQTIWSFLSIGWGLLADIDIDSEWLRFIGEFRFTVYGLLRSMTSVAYKGLLSIKLPPLDSDDNETRELIEKLKSESCTKMNNFIHDGDENTQLDNKTDMNSEWIHFEDKFACLYAVHQSHVNSTTKFSPKSTFTDQLTYLTYIRGNLNIFQVIEFLLAIQDGSHERLPYVRVVPVQSFIFQPLQPSKVVVDGEVIPWTFEDGPISATVVPKTLNLAWSSNLNNEATT
jgi:sphingosine kinase